MDDPYIVALSKIIYSLEKIYGIKKHDSRGIDDIVSQIQSDVLNLDSDIIFQKNEEAGQHCVMLSYISRRLMYYGSQKLSYRNYPALLDIVDVLIKFLKASTVDVEAERELGKIITLIREIEKYKIGLRMGLSYRFLRLFVIMCLYQNKFNASIVSEFIISQLTIDCQSDLARG